MVAYVGHHPSVQAASAHNVAASWRPQVMAQLAVHDWIVLGYLVILFILTLVHHSSTPSTLPITLTTINVALFLGVLVVARAPGRSGSVATSILYRVALIALPVASYIGLRWILPVIAPRTLDHELLLFDLQVFGFEPALAWDGWVTPARTEWFSFFYFSYFLLLAAYAIPIALFAKDGRLLREFTLGALSIFCVGQLFYALVPGVGPYLHESTRDMFASSIDGPIFWPLVRDTVERAGALRDIFPSLHAGMPVFLTLFAFRYRARSPFRYTWLATGFIATQIIVATMYLRWHYLIDIVAGIALAIALNLASGPIVRWEASRRVARSERWASFARPLSITSIVAPFKRGLSKLAVVIVMVSVLLSFGCGAGSRSQGRAVLGPSPSPSPSAVSTSDTTTIDPEGEQDDDPALSFEVRMPKRVRWSSSTLGPVKPTLSIVVTNRSPDRTVNIANVQARILVTREGIAFRCRDSVGAAPAPATTREPTILAPNTSATLERPLDCALPLTGKYAVRVSVSFGPEGARRSRALQAYSLNVAASENVAPRPIPGVRGAWAAIGASNLLVGETRAGAGRIVVSIVNGSATTLTLPSMKLAMRVYRQGSRIPCVDTPTRLKAPSTLASGGSYQEPIEVSCLGLGTPGQYEVVAQLLVGASDDGSSSAEQEVDIGRLRIEVSNDPSRRMSPLF